MSDNWSLKDRKWFEEEWDDGECAGDTLQYENNREINDDEMEYFYCNGDIETLRKEIIDIMIQWIKNNDEHIWMGSISVKNLLGDINRLFGVRNE